VVVADGPELLAGPGGVPDPRINPTLALDPKAARTVLRSGVPVRVISVDASNDAPLTFFFADTLRRYHYASPEATAVWVLLAQIGYTGGSYLRAVFGAVALTTPRLATFERRRVGVVVGHGKGPAHFAVGGRGVRIRYATAGRARLFQRVLLE